MQKIKKFLSVFLAILVVVSIFSIDASAEFVGTGSDIGTAPIRPDDYNTPVLNNTESSVVGYRFSIVNTSGTTLKNSNDGKFRTIDLIRKTLPSGDKNNVYAYTDGSGAEGTSTTKKMAVRLNKYQWNKLYRSGGQINVGRVTSKANAGTNTYGMKYVTDIGTGDLPYTTGVETWTTTPKNRSALLNALGYSTTTSNVDSVLGRNRIVIEPLFRVKWDKAWTLFSACDLAIMNYAYYANGNANFPHGTGEKNGKYGQYGSTMIRRFTNGLYQECLYIGTSETNLKMPSDAPLTHVSAIKDPQNSSDNKIKNLWTYDEIIKSTLGMALYYNKELEAQANAVLKVRFHDTTLDNLKCNTTSTYYKGGSDGIIRGNGKIYEQTIPANGTNANGLTDSGTFGLSAPDGYHWISDENGNRSWRFYSYDKNETPYYLRQSDHGAIASSKAFWQAIYHDTENVTVNESGTAVIASWRYNESGKQMSELKTTQTVHAYPDIKENKVTIVYHGNGGTKKPLESTSQTKDYSDNTLFYLKEDIFSRDGFTFVGWSTDADRDAADFDKTTNTDFMSKAAITSPRYLAGKVGKGEEFKKGDITIDLYAVWEGKGLEIKYNPNGGQGKVESQSIENINDKNATVTLYDKDRVNTNVKDGEIPFKRYGYDLVGWERKNKTVNITGTYILTNFSFSQTIKPAKELLKYKPKLLSERYNTAAKTVTLNAVWREKNEKTQIDVSVTPKIIAPTAFVDKWDSPLGTTETPKYVYGILYHDGKLVDFVSVAINGNYVTVNGPLESLEYGDYTLELRSPTEDSYLVGAVNGKRYEGSVIKIPLSCNGATQTLNFELKNYTHTINVDYKTQFNDFQNTAFVTALTTGEGETATTVIERYNVGNDGKKTLIVPGYVKDAEGALAACSYSTYMENTPEYYTPDDRVYDTGEIDYLKDNVYNASFENWYIWDFAVVAEPSVSTVDRGETFNIQLSAKNKRPKINAPAVTVEVLLDSDIIKTLSLTINGNSEINETMPVTIPADAELGNHTVTVKINYDKYLETGYNYLYEENMEDNEVSFEIGVGRILYNLNVIYHSNDGADKSSTDKFVWDDDVITKGSIFTRDGYMFNGWALAPDSDTVTYIGNTNIGKAQEVDPNLETKNCTLNLYAVWSKIEEPQDGSIVIDVSSIVKAPTQFADKWNNPEGRYSVVTLYLNGEVKARKNITIPKSGGTVNTVTFPNMDAGTYKVEITVPTKDCYYDKNGETAATVTLEHTGLQTKQSFVLKNNTHTVNITYTNQFNEHLDDAVFTTTIYKDGKPIDTVSLKPTLDGKLSFTVPACDPDGHIYTYSTVMDKAPTNYSKDTSKHTVDGFPTNASTHVDMSFKSWYIWDFSVTTRLSDTSQTEYQNKGGFEQGETIDVVVSSQNARSHKNSPKVTVEVFFDNQLIKTESLAINANSKSESTVPVTIPANANIGAHRITAYINYDKYNQYGADYLYETAVADNTSILDFNVADGDIMITPVALNGAFCINDTVFASFYVYNSGLKDVLKENGAKVEATLFYTAIDGTDKSVVLDTVENVVIPNRNYVDNRNLVYFKFVIPDDAMLNVNCAVMATVDGGTAFDTDSSNNKAAIIRTINFRATSNTPDYGRALDTPRGMLNKCGVPNLTRYAEKSTSSVVGNVASWNEWTEESSKTLKLQSYAVKANLDAIVKIDNRCLTAAFEDGDLVLKSGYGVTLAVQPIIEATSGVTGAMYGKYNTANAYYPEYGYAKEIGKYSTLQFLKTDADRSTSQFTEATAFADRANTHDVPILGTAPRWELPQCTFSSFYYEGNGMARKHFTPLWWKDGRYTIVCDMTELWTPAGMVGAEAIAHSGEGGDVYISGSVYDNYYTARG